MAYDVPQQATGLRHLPFIAVGGQPAFNPDDLERFVSERRVAVLAYLRHDSRPHQSPIWYTYHDGVFFLTTVTDSPKHRALQRDGRVSLTVQDERPPYRAVVLEGTAELAPLDPDRDPTQGMAVRYFGRVGAAEYRRLTASTYAASGLTLVALRPTAVRGFDNTRALSTGALAFVRLREHLPVPRRWL
ncbi:MAG: PPOX class F420-dependent oxidoreductase [Actinobacteria bacterium]|nr:PPOX class F420-dependent oxidoreductase [Actinomycetota bacterium]